MTQQFSGGVSVTWRRPLSSDGAFAMHNVTKRLEVRGVPFGSRTWTHLERIIRPASTLRKIVSNGLQIGDPNCVCLDVEVDGEKEIPNIILTAVEGGRDTKITMAELPPPPPLSQCPHLASSPSSTMRVSQSSMEQQQEECRQPDTGRSGSPARSRTPCLSSTPPFVIDPSEESSGPQANGPRDSSLLCYSRRRQVLQPGTPRRGSCWFSQLVERQWVTLRTQAQADIPSLGALESPKTQDVTPTELLQSQEERRPDFIPDWVALLPTSEVGQEMGAECGGVSRIQ